MHEEAVQHRCPKLNSPWSPGYNSRPAALHPGSLSRPTNYYAPTRGTGQVADSAFSPPNPSSDPDSDPRGLGHRDLVNPPRINTVSVGPASRTVHDPFLSSRERKLNRTRERPEHSPCRTLLAFAHGHVLPYVHSPGGLLPSEPSIFSSVSSASSPKFTLVRLTFDQTGNKNPSITVVG